MIFQKLQFKNFRKTYWLRICFFAFLLNALTAATSIKTDDNNWSGSITYTYTKITHHAAPYSETIFEKWDKNYKQFMEAKIVNGTGTASSTISLSDTSLSREQTGSRTVEQWEIEKGTAEGTANTEASINIDLQHKTYSIEVQIPETTGNKTKTFFCKGCGQAPAEPVTTSLGEDETSIVVEDEKLGADPNVLSGEKIERTKTDNGETEEITVTHWMFTKGKS